MDGSPSIPPLRDLPAGRVSTLKSRLLAEISHNRARRTRLFAPGARRRGAIAAVAAITAASVAGLVLTTQTDILPRHSSASHGARSHLPPSRPVTIDFTTGAKGVTAIDLAVNSPTSDASLQVQVLRSNATQPLQAMQESRTDQQVVYQERVSMTNLAPPADAIPGVTSLATWSGTLSPSDWTGGCQNSLYTVEISITAKDGTPVRSGNSKWFTCSSG